MSASGERMNVNGIDLEVLRRGQGAPVVLLHGMDTVNPKAPFLDLLGRQVAGRHRSRGADGHSR